MYDTKIPSHDDFEQCRGGVTRISQDAHGSATCRVCCIMSEGHFAFASGFWARVFNHGLYDKLRRRQHHNNTLGQRCLLFTVYMSVHILTNIDETLLAGGREIRAVGTGAGKSSWAFA